MEFSCGNPSRRRSLGLLPHDLAAGEEVQVVLEDRHDVGGEAAIRLAPQVGHVDRDPPPRLEHALAFREHVTQEREVLDVGARHAFPVELLLVLLAREVRGRRYDEGDRVVRDLVHVAGIAAHTRQPGHVRGHALVGTELRWLEARVEGVGHVRFAAPDTEIRG